MKECHICQHALKNVFHAHCSNGRCKKTYCAECIKQHFDKQFSEEILKSKDWVCYSCQKACRCKICTGMGVLNLERELMQQIMQRQLQLRKVLLEQNGNNQEPQSQQLQKGQEQNGQGQKGQIQKGQVQNEEAEDKQIQKMQIQQQKNPIGHNGEVCENKTNEDKQEANNTIQKKQNEKPSMQDQQKRQDLVMQKEGMQAEEDERIPHAIRKIMLRHRNLYSQEKEHLKGNCPQEPKRDSSIIKDVKDIQPQQMDERIKNTLKQYGKEDFDNIQIIQ